MVGWNGDHVFSEIGLWICACSHTIVWSNLPYEAAWIYHLREYRNAHGMDPPWMLLDGDFQQHDTVLTLHTSGLLPPGSPLPNPATTCAPQRTVGLAAGTTHCSSSSLPALDINGILRPPVSPPLLRWSVHSALNLAARGALPDDVLQQAL